MKILFVLVLSLVLMCGCTDGTTTPEEENPVEENKVIEVNSKTWNKVLEAKFAMVDFYADWCSPCKKIAPIVEELAKDNPTLSVFKLDIDDNKDIYVKYRIMGVPTLIFFKEGKEVNRIVGLQTKKYIQERINSLLKKKEKRERKERNCEGGVCTPGY